MKKVSVIVPVYKVEDYLERCLNSLVHQTLEDIEIIVVNDGSPDNSQAIIDRFAEEFPNKIVSLVIENGGVANARNQGLSIASGEYIGFVDSDDYVDPQMFEKLYERAICDRADIVTSGYTRVYANSSKDFQLGDTGYYRKSIKEEPLLLVVGVPYIWNKLFRREMLEKNGIVFRKFSIFEDLLFTYGSFAYANRIAKCDMPTYYYRVRREGSVTNRFTRKFFDLFEVMDLLCEEYRKAGIYEQMKDYLLCIFLRHGMLRLEEPTEFGDVALKLEYTDRLFDYLEKNFPEYRSHRLYLEHYDGTSEKFLNKNYWMNRIKVAPIIPNRKKLARNEKLRKIYNLMKTAGNRGAKVLQLGGLSKTKRLIGHQYLEYYKTLPIDEKAVLLDSQHGDDINGNMFYLLRYMHSDPRYSEYTFYIPVSEKRVDEFHKKLSFYGIERVVLPIYESDEHLRVLASAKYLFTDTSFMTYFIKKEGQVYLNTWHGTPFKTLGRASRDEMHRIGNLQKNFRIADYLLYPSEYMAEHMLKDYMIDHISHNKILFHGYPRNVVFYEKENSRIRELEQMEGKQILAYLPTWRGSLNHTSGSSDMVSYLKELDQKLRDDQVCYVNLHPYMKGSISFDSFHHLKLMPQTYEVYDFLNSCDVLITDYSSVFFDFACTRKKIVLFAYDEEEYFRDRGVYFSFSELPFTKAATVDELLAAIDAPADYDDSDFLKRFCPYEGPDAAKDICDQIILGEDRNLNLQPIANNGKKNILIYVGKMPNNRETDLLINALYGCTGEDCNYYLSFRASDLADNKNVLRVLDERIGYVSILGSPSAGLEEQKLLYLLSRDRKAFGRNRDQAEDILQYEITRCYQDTGFDLVIVYNCIDLVMVSALKNLPCRKILYYPVWRKAYQRLSPEVYQAYDEVITADQKTKKQFEKNVAGQTARTASVRELL